MDFIGSVIGLLTWSSFICCYFTDSPLSTAFIGTFRSAVYELTYACAGLELHGRPPVGDRLAQFISDSAVALASRIGSDAVIVKRGVPGSCLVYFHHTCHFR